MGMYRTDSNKLRRAVLCNGGHIELGSVVFAAMDRDYRSNLGFRPRLVWGGPLAL